ncbi:MAG: GrpB family protein [Dehalococcoidia bacterium]
MSGRPHKTITIADYDAAWPARFERERALILDACGPGVFEAIEHIGSTSVPGLAAKPIIDIMPGVRSLAAITPAVIVRLEGIGHRYVPEYEQSDPTWGEGALDRRYFRKDRDGRRAFHMHVVELGSEFWERQLLFRDYLRTHPDDAAAYAALKREIAREFNALPPGERNAHFGYTERKTAFVEATLAKARLRRSV